MEPEIQPQSQSQSQSQSQKIKMISVAVVIFLILGIGYALSQKQRTSEPAPSLSGDESVPMKVVVENTPTVDGVTPAPAGLPKDIPIEKGNMLESATTLYPDQNAKQFSVSYQSSKTVAQKYAEYKDYMTRAGYTVTEGSTSVPVRAIFGAKADANLSVVVSSAEGKTLVQLAYLLK